MEKFLEREKREGEKPREKNSLESQRGENFLERERWLTSLR